ncbi:MULTISPECIES: hypothetical protein [Niallia]|jgi:hypothetical protein|nr:hypothetical protein [Niallia circulans]
MTKKSQMLLNIIMVIVSWLSIPLLGKQTIKRFSQPLFLVLLCVA